MVKKILLTGTVLAFITASYLIGLTVGKYNVHQIAYRIDHLEKQIGKYCVENSQSKDGWTIAATTGDSK